MPQARARISVKKSWKSINARLDGLYVQRDKEAVSSLSTEKWTRRLRGITRPLLIHNLIPSVRYQSHNHQVPHNPEYIQWT